MTDNASDDCYLWPSIHRPTYYMCITPSNA